MHLLRCLLMCDPMAHRTLVQAVQYRLDGLDCGWTAFDVEGQVFVSDAGESTSTAYPVKFAVRLFRCDPTCLGFIKDKGPAALDVPVSYLSAATARSASRAASLFP